MASVALVAAGVVVAGGLIQWTGWHWLDPAVSLVISALIVLGIWSLLRDAVILSLDAVPNGIDQDAVSLHLGGLAGVVEVHGLHIWGMSTTETALTAHLVRDDAALDDGLVQRACEAVRRRSGIGHTTFQVETSAMAYASELWSDNVV